MLQKAKKKLPLNYIRLKSRIEGDKENICCFTTWVYLKHILEHNSTPKKAQFLPLFNVNLSQPQLNSTSTQFQLNFDSTSLQPQPQINLSLNINLNSTSTLTSTQYGCDIKATQSCTFFICKSFHWFGYCQNQLTDLVIFPLESSQPPIWSPAHNIREK